jgi:hypothetical protein
LSARGRVGACSGAADRPRFKGFPADETVDQSRLAYTRGE